MSGTKTNSNPVRHQSTGYSNGAVSAAQYLDEDVINFPCRIIAVKVYAETAGTGGGNTVVDVLKNGTTVYTTAANKPTLAATSTGEFANTNPDITAFMPGDRLAIQVASVSSTGHARLFAAVTLGLQ